MEPNKLKSRRFWGAMVTAVIMALNAAFDFGISPTEAVAVVLPVIAFIIGESWKDAKAAGNGK